MDKATTIIACMFFLLQCCEVTPLKAQRTHDHTDMTAPKPPKPKKKLLYAVVKGSETYLIPYIERKLKNLRRPDADSVLYDLVESLNVLKDDHIVEATVFDDLNKAYAGRVKLEATPKEKSKHEDSIVKYSRFLSNYHAILAIKVTPLQDLVELQFTLYDIDSTKLQIQYRNSSSIFIDPRSAHYQADINRGLDQVFEEANKQPLVNLTSNFKEIYGAYYLTSEDTLLLQPIVDDESVEEDRIYFWTQDSLEKIRAPILPSKKDQSLRNLAPGIYHLYFKATNGINYSKTDTIVLDVYSRPLLSITRPHDQSFFRNFSDRFVIQEYVFANRQIDYFSDYNGVLDSTHFVGTPPELWVKVTDKKGATYATKSFPFRPPTYDSAAFSGKEVISDIDSAMTPVKAVRGNSYVISFEARNPAMQSKVVKNDLNVYQRWPFSLLYDVMIFPVDKYGLYHSWINAGVGLNLRLNRWLSGIIIGGTDLAQASFQHFYTDLVANFGPFKGLPHPYDKLEGGLALLINYDNGDQSTGVKLSYNFYSGSHTNLKIGASFYNQDHVNYFAIRLTGDIFFNH
jgi:hypothetical protein